MPICGFQICVTAVRAGNHIGILLILCRLFILHSNCKMTTSDTRILALHIFFFTFSYSAYFYKYIHTNKSKNAIPHTNTLLCFDDLILWTDYLQPIFAILILKKTVRECSFPTYSVFSFYILILFYFIYTFHPYYYYETHSHNINHFIQLHLLITNTLFLFKTYSFFDSTSHKHTFYAYGRLLFFVYIPNI